MFWGAVSMASCLLIVGSLTAAFGHATPGTGASTTVTWVVDGHPAVRNAIIGALSSRLFFPPPRNVTDAPRHQSSHVRITSHRMWSRAPKSPMQLRNHAARVAESAFQKLLIRRCGVLTSRLSPTDLFVCSFASTWGPASWSVYLAPAGADPRCR